MKIIKHLKVTLASILIFITLTVNASQEVSSLRLIALSPHLVELLYDLGAQNHIIGTTSATDFPQSAERIPRVGDHTRLQIEKIVAFQPDVIVAWRSGNPPEDLQRLEKMGFRVVYFDPKELADIASDITRLGDLVGKQEKASALSQQFLTNLNLLEKRYADSTPVETFFEIWSSPLQTISRNAWPQKHLELCGAKNIFANLETDYPSVSIEQVLTNKPLVIIQPQSSTSPGSLLTNWQKFPFIPAVERGHILTPDADKLFRMSRRVLDEVATLCAQIDKARRGNTKGE